MISSLALSLSLFYLLMGVAASALLCTSAAHFAVKIVVPSLLVALACVTYKTMPDMFGYPVETDFASLPSQAELIAFLPYDDEKKVDLWLMREGAIQPRAYSVEMTDELKNTLRQAQKAKADGSRAMLAKVSKKGGVRRPNYTDMDGGNAPYELLPNDFELPKKEEGGG